MKKERKSLIKVKGGFGDRTGISPYKVGLQTDDFDVRTRVYLSNKLFELLELLFDDYNARDQFYNAGDRQMFCKQILSEVFAQSIILKEGYSFAWRKLFDNNILYVMKEADYSEVLDIIWYICNWIYNNFEPKPNGIFAQFNEAFERESVGYRFVDRNIVAITTPEEIEEIEKACSCNFDGCKAHIKKAVGFLSERDNKDYKNSIKESISAVESICQIILDSKKATLGGALKELKDKGLALHPALEKSFSSLYGYTSDEGGIRHCEGLFESNVSFEDAKYMIVVCSAFVNYLIAQYEKLGV